MFDSEVLKIVLYIVGMIAAIIGTVASIAKIRESKHKINAIKKDTKKESPTKNTKLEKKLGKQKIKEAKKKK